MSENKLSFGHGFCSWNILTFIMQEILCSVHTSRQIRGLNVVRSPLSFPDKAPKVVALQVASNPTTQHTQSDEQYRLKSQ
jgi:hypothetical protein